MSRFFTDYFEAHTHACTEARRGGREMQLARTKELGKTGYVVRMAVGAAHRYGSDAQGEFIKPIDPMMAVRA